MTIRELTLLSVAIALGPFALFSWVPTATVGDLGSLLASSAGFIAVIWFYRGLRLQSLQIEEQRKQFATQYRIQHHDSLLAFLQSASEKTEAALEELIDQLSLDSPDEITTCYLNSVEKFKIPLESADPDAVVRSVKDWMETEGPCVKFLSAVRDVIILHKMRLGLEADSTDEDVADYVYVNSSHLLRQPLMTKYQGVVSMLAEQMMLLSPGRKKTRLAFSAAMAMLLPEGVVKLDEVLAEIEELREQGKSLPVICERLSAEREVE